MDNGGDGANLAPITGEEPQGLPPIEGEQSATQEELEARIEAELGLPHVESKVEEVADEPEEVDEPTEPEKPVEEPESTPSESTSKADTAPTEPSNPDFTIEVEDGEGVTHKISSLSDLPEDFQYKNARQPLEIYRQLDKLEADKATYEKEQADAAITAAETQAQTEQFDAWDREITELSKAKRLNANDQDTVTKVFEHMAEINAARAKAGNPNMISSFEDALDKYEASQAKAAASDNARAENDRAKLKASLIGGNNSTTASTASRPYVSGSYRSIDDIPL